MTANAAETTSLPIALVNGDFEYPANVIDGVTDDHPWDSWTVIQPDTGTRLEHPSSGDQWVPVPDWDRSRFAWTSDQTEDQNDPNGWTVEHGVELQKDWDGNQYAEIVAQQTGKAIHQDINTMHDTATVYTVRLKHASQTNRYLDRMQVLIGAPGHEQPVTMTRETSNGNGDKVGESSDVIATRVSNEPDGNYPADTNRTSRNHAGQWETYVGSVTIPAHQDVTRFTFRSVDSPDAASGNLVDDITFRIAYPLSYDANGGAGKVPSDSKPNELKDVN